MRRTVSAIVVLVGIATAAWLLHAALRDTPERAEEALAPPLRSVATHQPTPPISPSADPREEPVFSTREEGASISGRVYDSGSARTVVGAILYASNRSGENRTTNTDEEGRYRLDALGPGNWTILLQTGTGNPSVAGPKRPKKFITLKGRQVVQGFDFPLEFGTMLSGVVVAESGERLAGASIRADYPQRQEAVSDAEGQFTITGLLSEKKLRVRTEKEAYAPAYDEWTELPASGLKGIAITLVRESSISGVVVDRNGTEVTRASVLAVDEHEKRYTSRPPRQTVREIARSDVRRNQWGGAFELRGLPSGSYSLYARKEPILDSFSSGMIIGLQPDGAPLVQVTVAKAQQRQNVRVVMDIEEYDLMLLNGPEVTGFVRDAAGALLEGVEVGSFMDNVSSQATTDADGFYRLQLKRAEKFSLFANSEGFSIKRKGPLPADTLEVDFRLQRQGVIRGRVLDAHTGAPIAAYEIARTRHPTTEWDAKIRYDYERVSHTEGEFKLEELNVGDTTVIVRAKGFAPTLETVSVAPGSLTEIELRLEMGLAVRGRVLDPMGEPVAEAQIFVGDIPDHMEMSDGNSYAATAFTSPEGTFALESLPRSIGRITAFSPGYLETSIDFTGVPGSETDVEIVLREGGAVEGVVRLAVAALAGQTLTIRNSDLRFGELETVTDSAGRYRFAGLPTGSWTILAVINPHGDAGNSYRDARTVHVEADATTTENFDIGSNTSVEGYLLGLQDDEKSLTVNVFWRDADGNRLTASEETDAEGYFRIDHLQEGTAQLRATLYIGGHATRTLEADVVLSEGSVVRHDFDFSRLAVARGRVTFRAVSKQAVVMAVPESRTIGDLRSEFSTLFETARRLELYYLLQRTGDYSITFPKSGVYTVFAVLTNEESPRPPTYADAVVTVEAGDEIEIDFDLR